MAHTHPRARTAPGGFRHAPRAVASSAKPSSGIVRVRARVEEGTCKMMTGQTAVPAWRAALAWALSLALALSGLSALAAAPRAAYASVPDQPQVGAVYTAEGVVTRANRDEDGLINEYTWSDYYQDDRA